MKAMACDCGYQLFPAEGMAWDVMGAGMWPWPGASGAFRAENLKTHSPVLQGVP